MEIYLNDDIRSDKILLINHCFLDVYRLYIERSLEYS